MNDEDVTITEEGIARLENGETVTLGDKEFSHINHRDGDEWLLTEATFERLRETGYTEYGPFKLYYQETDYEDDADEEGETQTVTLEVEVDATGASEQQLEMYREMADIFGQRFELFVEKNLDYDSSFLSSGKVEQALDSGDGPFDTVHESNLYKLFTRIQDKDQRFYSLAFTDNEDRVGETAAETAGDAGVYWFMIQWLIENEAGN